MGHQSVEILSQEGHNQIKIDFDNHRRRPPIEMKKCDLLADGFFNQPSSRLFLNDLGDGLFNIIGDDHRWVDFSTAGQDDLPEVFIIPS